MADDVSVCYHCSDNFIVNTKLILCEFCSNRFHVSCVKLKDSWCKLINDCDNLMWFCDTCKDDIKKKWKVDNENNETSNALALEVNHLKQDLENARKLENELQTVNNLLKHRLCELDESYSQILNQSQKSISNISKLNTLQEMVLKPSFSDVLKNDNSAVLILEAKNTNKCDINTLKDNVNPVDLGPGITQIRTARNGKTILKCLNSDHMQSIKTNLERSMGKDFTVTVPSKKNPKIRIYHLEKTDITNDILEGNIIKQNMFDKNEKFKILTKINYVKSSNIIAEVSPNLFHKIISQGYLFVGWSKCPVKECFNIIRCYKCSSYGHMENQCTSSITICPICSKQHKLKDCPKNSVSCINCINSNSQFKTKYRTDHSSKDINCSIYLKQIELAKTKINYSQT